MLPEKFFNIVTRAGDFKVDACVVVTTIRALKEHGNGDLVKGFPNLEAHVENMMNFGVPVVVAINRFPDDTQAEIDAIRKQCKTRDVCVVVSDVFAKGSKGGIDLANEVIKTLETKPPKPIIYTYKLDDSLKTKIEKVAKQIYGARGVDYTTGASGQLRSFEKRGYGNLPICVAKTQFSLSDHRGLKGRPTGFDVEVNGADVSAGAGFIVVYMGDISLMPGLPDEPAAVNMDIDEEGNISGVF